MIISIIAAVAEKNYVIGSKNKLIWHLPEDLRRFKKLTYGHHIIMGRKTFESLPKPLPGRVNLILTRDKSYSVANENCFVFNSLDSALRFCRKNNESEVFVIGGSQVYKLALPLADKLYLTWVKGDFSGDAYFPKFDFDSWVLVDKQDFPSFSFAVYKRR